MMDKNIREVLKNNCILGKAQQKNIEEYLNDEVISVLDFAVGEEIISPKQSKKAVGIILSGTAVVAPASGGENAILKIIHASHTFGISNLYADSQPFPSVITAKSACSVLFIDGNAFMRLIENDPGALRAYLAVLNNKIVYLNEKISTLTAGSAQKKLAVYLAENCTGGEFSEDISMSSLADMLNVGRASLYRSLDRLTSRGIIERDGKKIKVKDKNALLSFL